MIKKSIVEVLKTFSAKMYSFKEEPTLEFKKLTAEELIAELREKEKKEMKLLLKKHTKLLREVSDKWVELSETDSFQTGREKILKHCIDDGWKRNAIEDGLDWLVAKSYAIVQLRHPNLKKSIEETRTLLNKFTEFSSQVNEWILIEIKNDEDPIICYSNEGFKKYL